MEQVKIFLKYIEYKKDAKKLEKKINMWLNSNPDIQLTQRFAVNNNEGTIITIFYKQSLSI